MAGNVAKSHFKLYVWIHSTEVFCTLCLLFVRLGCRLLCGRLAVHSLGVHSVFGKNHSGNGNEYSGCVRVRYNSLFISLPFFIKQQHEKATVCVFERT